MKIRNNYLCHAAALLLLMLAAACTADDDFDPAPSPDSPAVSAPPLTITVTDGAYAPAPTADDNDDTTPATATRAVERGYATEFTAGDKIGLYEVTEKEQGNGGSIYSGITQNLCLTYDGTAWTLPSGKELSPGRQQDVLLRLLSLAEGRGYGRKGHRRTRNNV